jgi:hypothetical protein
VKLNIIQMDWTDSGARIFSSKLAINCPVCGTTVTPNVEHTCGDKAPPPEPPTRPKTRTPALAVSKPSGLADKLYWRRVFPASHQFHCFKKAQGGGYVSLCANRYTLTYSGGQSIRRPDARLRCAQCDIEEMKRRGWSESGPATV